MATQLNKFCGNCGNPMPVTAKHCPACGTPFHMPDLDPGDGTMFMTNPHPTAVQPLSSNPLSKIVLAQGIAIILLFMAVLVLLVHTFVGAPSTSLGTLSPIAGASATATPAGPHVLYQASWSGDDTWQGTPDWKEQNGVLVNDGSNAVHNLSTPTIMVPYDLSTMPDYAIEAQIQVTKTSNSPGFGFFVRYDNQGHGYIAGAGSPQGSPPSVFEITTAAGWRTPLQQMDFSPGKTTHTYRIEVKQDHISVYIDGRFFMDQQDERYPSGAYVGLWDSDAQLSISSFVIKSL
jgi:hypothetical protein